MSKSPAETSEIAGFAFRSRYHIWEAGHEDGAPVADICRKAGISQATYFNWKKKYAGMMPSEMKRLRELEDENGRLKRIVADLSLDKEMLQDIVRRKL